MNDLATLITDEKIVLEKFEGDPEDEYLLERVHLHNGKIVRHEYYNNGELVSVETLEE